MTAKKKADAFSRGYCSVLELLPSKSRSEHRDAIVEAQLVSPHIVWTQVGELLRGAECELTGTKSTQSECRQERLRKEGQSSRAGGYEILQLW